MLVHLATTAQGETRRRSLRVLADVARGDRSTVAVLASLLSGVESLEVFTEIVETLRAIGDPESVAAAFASCARSSAAPDVRAMALVELAALSSTVPSASTLLDSILNDGLDSLTTSELANGVRSGKVTEPRILRLAIGVIRDDRDASQLGLTLSKLGEAGRGNPEVTAFLRETFRNIADSKLAFQDARPLTRDFALSSAAGSLLKADPGCREAFDSLVSIIEPGCGELLADAGSDPRKDGTGIVRLLRRGAIENLAKSAANYPETISTLRRLLAKESDPSLKCDLASALTRFISHEADALRALIDVLPLSLDPYWTVDEVSFRAAKTLSVVAPGNPDAVAAAVSLITQASSDRERRYGASILELVGVGNVVARDQLAALFRSATEKWVRWQAFWALVRVAHGSPEHESALLDALGDDEQRDSVLRNFSSASMRSPRIVEALRLLLSADRERPDPYFVSSALASVAGGDAPSVALLTKLLTTASENNVEGIARDLLAIVDVTHMPAVVEALAPFGTRPKSKKADDRARFQCCNKVLWHCCENLPFPIFTEAFHRGIAAH
jgi:hypothetical protein